MSRQSDEVLHLTLLGEAALHADAVVFLADEEGRVVAMNDAGCDLTGYTRAEFGALTLDQVLDESSLLHRDGSTVTGSFQAVETRVASLPYLLGLFVPDVQAHRRLR